jgi:hypothetical protein
MGDDQKAQKVQKTSTRVTISIPREECCFAGPLLSYLFERPERRYAWGTGPGARYPDDAPAQPDPAAEVDEEVAPHSAAANSVEDDTCPHGEADEDPAGAPGGGDGEHDPAPHSAAANSVEDDTCPHGEADEDPAGAPGGGDVEHDPESK